jgi:rod shape-determining protein MreD
MTRSRVLAALAAIITALLLQATLIGPLTMPFAASLPAVLVAAVAQVDGPAAGMSFGFSAGLLADLGSSHPAGVLALTWLGLGLICGKSVDRRSVWGDALHAAVLCALAGIVSQVILAIAHVRGADVGHAVLYAPVVALIDLGLALLVIPLVRRAVSTERLRAPHPVLTQLQFRPPHV